MDNFENRGPERDPFGEPETNREERRNDGVQYYYGDGSYQGNAVKTSKFPTWAKVVIAVALVILCIVLLATSCTKSIAGAFSGYEDMLEPVESVVPAYDHDYIGVLHVETEISEGGASSAYNHQYILDSIESMMNEDTNKGIIIYMNTPGGSVYATDEVYLKLMEYKEKTGRPIYSAMQSQATSGGYYLSAACDKIYANRNCWTGSIGVTIGTLYDISGLLDELGIKTQTITSGANKAMGSYVEPMTDEQKEIFQSLVDEAYEQFVEIVAEGRNMSVKEVKKLADGRIYTAKQAKENGLIDEIGTYEEAVQNMRDEYGLDTVALEDFIPSDSTDIMSLLGITAENLSKNAAADPDSIQALIDLNGKFEVSYKSQITK